MNLTGLPVEIRSKKTDKLLCRDIVISHVLNVKRPYIRLERSTRRYYIDGVIIQFNLFQL